MSGRRSPPSDSKEQVFLQRAQQARHSFTCCHGCPLWHPKTSYRLANIKLGTNANPFALQHVDQSTKLNVQGYIGDTDIGGDHSLNGVFEVIKNEYKWKWATLLPSLYEYLLYARRVLSWNWSSLLGVRLTLANRWIKLDFLLFLNLVLNGYFLLWRSYTNVYKVSRCLNTL